MAKKFQTIEKFYNVSADVVTNSGGVIETHKFSGEGMAHKSVRDAKASIRDSYNGEVIAIVNIKFELVKIKRLYEIKADNDSIVNACREFGLVVEQIA